jgi:hypothetical protein
LAGTVLTVRFADDANHPQVQGTIQLREGKAPTVLVAGGSAEATCADRNGDGLAGLVALTVPFQNVRTGAIVPVTFVSERELDASGPYTIVVRGLTEEPIAWQVQVRVIGPAPPAGAREARTGG